MIRHGHLAVAELKFCCLFSQSEMAELEVGCARSAGASVDCCALLCHLQSPQHQQYALFSSQFIGMQPTVMHGLGTTLQLSKDYHPDLRTHVGPKSPFA